MSSAKKKPNKGAASVEKFPAPDIENLVYDENYMFDCGLKNEYKNICGALDSKEHPLSTYVIENGLLNKRDDMGKTCFDLAAFLGNKDFIRTILERTGDRLDETIFNFRDQINAKNSYNFVHYACIWGRLDLCKYLIDSQKLIVDPSVDVSQLEPKTLPLYQKTLGSILLAAKAKTGETPIMLAKRYEHESLVEYLTVAEKRQGFIDYISETKKINNDPEKNLNKLTKDDKKKLDILCLAALDWTEKNRENNDLNFLEQKIKETKGEIDPILAKISEEVDTSLPQPSKSAKNARK
jgi:ankyrin repeat protein